MMPFFFFFFLVLNRPCMTLAMHCFLSNIGNVRGGGQERERESVEVKHGKGGLGVEIWDVETSGQRLMDTQNYNRSQFEIQMECPFTSSFSIFMRLMDANMYTTSVSLRTIPTYPTCPSHPHRASFTTSHTPQPHPKNPKIPHQITLNRNPKKEN